MGKKIIKKSLSLLGDIFYHIGDWFDDIAVWFWNKGYGCTTSQGH
jgi:hypothetical protein